MGDLDGSPSKLGTPDKINVREDTNCIATHVASEQHQDALERDAIIKKTCTIIPESAA